MCELISEDGTKVSKARQWRLTVVNHLWLEDCFAQWQWLSPADNRYINFPPGVDWVTNVGSRVIDRSLEDPDQLDQAEAEELEAEDVLVPNGTENSARDAREVAEFINADGMDDEMFQDATDGTEEPQAQKARPSLKTTHKLSTRPTQTAETVADEIDDFGTIEGVQTRARLLRHTMKKPPSPPHDDADSAPNHSSRRKKGKASVLDHGDESEVETVGKGKAKSTSSVDDDSDLENFPIVILGSPNTRSGKLKGQASPLTPLMQTKRGRPYKASTTPTKVLSKPTNDIVTMSMPLRTKSSGSGKPGSTVIKPTSSIQMIAAERPAPSSPMKVKQASDSTHGRSRRSAATKAEQRLRDEVMPDVNNFEQERRNKRRKSGVGTSNVGSQKLLHERRKGKISLTEDEDEDEDGRTAKRRRLSSSTELDMTEDEVTDRKRRQSTVSSIDDTRFVFLVDYDL